MKIIRNFPVRKVIRRSGGKQPNFIRKKFFFRQHILTDQIPNYSTVILPSTLSIGKWNISLFFRLPTTVVEKKFPLSYFLCYAMKEKSNFNKISTKKST